MSSASRPISSRAHRAIATTTTGDGLAKTMSGSTATTRPFRTGDAKGGQDRAGQGPDRMWRLLKQTVLAFIDDEALSRGAAIAFYTVTSIAPVLLLVVAVAG